MDHMHQFLMHSLYSVLNDSPVVKQNNKKDKSLFELIDTGFVQISNKANKIKF